MSETASADPVLAVFKQELEKLYGPRLEQALLYGSRARGDRQPDSDDDVLVVVDGPFDRWVKSAASSRPPTQSSTIGGDTTGQPMFAG